MHIPMQRGDSLTTPVRGDHAVVLGASMSGLLAARVLTEHFAQVTIVERDRLPADGGPRRGVPQGRHAHVVLPRAASILDELFPRFLDELVEAGSPFGETLDQMYYELNGHLFYRDPGPGAARPSGDGRRLYEPSRPLLEAAVLRRVLALPNVEIIQGCDVEGLTTNNTRSRVTGARIVSRDDSPVRRDLVADLVIAATGRGGRAPAWLDALGYPMPAEREVAVDVKYVTQRVRFPAGSVEPLLGVVVGVTAERPTGCFAFVQEGGQWIVTFQGYAGNHPPLNRDAWLAFGDTFLPSGFADALHAAEPLEDLHQHRFAANLRRHYEGLSRFPEGFLVLGDALCSFNPVYGQGMAVAALEAVELRDALRLGGDELAARFFKAAAKPVGNAWNFAVGGDLSLPEAIVPGPRPMPVRAVNAYVDRVQAAAEHDPVMAWRFFDVFGFEQPASALFGPDSLRRLASDRLHHRRTGSALELAVAAGKGWTWP